MTRPPLEGALDVLAQRLRLDAAACVRRTEVRDDESLVITIEDDAGPRCFHWRAGMLLELALADDALVPAAADLADARRRGAAQLVSWRPGRRAVVRVDARDAAHVVKAWKRGRARGAARVHEHVRAALGADGFRMPRLQRVDEARDTVTYEWAPGVELSVADVGACHRIGRALAQFQRRVPIQSLPVRRREDEFGELTVSARRVRWALGRLPTGFESTLERLAPLVEDAPEPSVAAHRDLHDGQVLVTSEHVTLLDLDLCARAEPEQDVANFSVHLSWCGITGARDASARVARLAESAFLAGCGDGLDPRALAFHRAATALRVALVFAVRPRWAPHVEQLVGVASEALAEESRV